MIQIQLPDGSKRPFDKPVSVMDVAASIGAGLAKAALAGKVDGKLVDTSFSSPTVEACRFASSRLAVAAVVDDNYLGRSTTTILAG